MGSDAANLQTLKLGRPVNKSCTVQLHADKKSENLPQNRVNCNHFLWNANIFSIETKIGCNNVSLQGLSLRLNHTL